MTRPATPETPRLEPCSDVNPELWRYFCKLRNREPNRSDVWSEADVIQHLDAAEQARKDNRAYRMFDAILHASERSTPL
jgi:hypothetical protein